MRWSHNAEKETGLNERGPDSLSSKGVGANC